MKLLRVFGIGAKKILQMDCCTKGVVTKVQISRLYVVKKPVRIGISVDNTAFSHFITFAYEVDGVAYTGKFFLTPYERCPQKGDQIDVYYDPEKPDDYAGYGFGPKARLFGG